MRVKLWYRGFEVTIEGDVDVTMKALDVMVRLIGEFAEQLKSGRG